jgi:polyhydroxybutyrate depolymerase
MDRMRRALLIAVTTLASIAALSALTACTGGTPTPRPTPTPQTFATGTSAHSFEFDGATREYLVHVPETLTPGPTTLVVMLHGGFGSAKQAESTYGWDEISEERGIIVAYPDGLGRAWNAGDCCGTSARKNVDDVGFIETMINQIGLGLEIDPQRIYATGMSNGAIMAYRLACETDTFAAIAPVAGTMLVDCPDPHPLSIIAIHGLVDTSVPFDGSVGQGAQAIDGPPIAEVWQSWQAVDGCPLPDPAIPYGGDPRVQAVDVDCADFTAFEGITISDAGHQWPGASSSQIRDELGGDPPSTLLDATRTIEAFFEGHPRPAG